MGGVLSSTGSLITDHSLIQDYKNATLKDIQNALRAYYELQDRLAITSEEFEEIFCLICGDTEAHFKVYNTNGNGKIDALEVFAVAIIYNKASFDERVKAIFVLFDFDGNGGISYPEFIMLLASTCRGLCKVVNSPWPSTHDIEIQSAFSFKELDQNHDNLISIDEFITWARSDPTISNYLSKFTNIRMIYPAQKLFNETYQNISSKFLEYSLREELHQSQQTEMEHVLHDVYQKTPPTNNEVDPSKVDEEREATHIADMKVKREPHPPEKKQGILPQIFNRNKSKAKNEPISPKSKTAMITKPAETSRVAATSKDLGHRQSGADRWKTCPVVKAKSLYQNQPRCTFHSVRSLLYLLQTSGTTNNQEIETLIAFLKTMFSPEATDEQTIYFTFSQFCSFISPYIAFRVADANSSGTIDIKELKILLWLMRQKEPTDEQVNNALESMDEDKNHVVSLMEWVEYNVMRDQETGLVAFDGHLRQLFDECDDDGNGIITTKELTNGIRRIVTLTLTHFNMQNGITISDSMWAFIDTMIAGLSNELIHLIDENKSQTIDWTEFKKHLEVIEGRIADVKVYLQKYIMEQGAKMRT